MSAIITIRGRLGAAPTSRETSNGSQMATGSLAVTLPSRQEDETEWFNLIPFGRVAEVLGGHKKGDALVAMGELQVNKYTTRDGKERRNLQVPIESLMTPKRARVVANGTPSKKKESKPQGEANPDEPFDDDISF